MRLLSKVFLLLTAAVLAAPAAATEYKIGYVDVRQAVERSEEAQAAKGQLESQVQERQTELKSRRATIEKLQKELQQQGSLMSEEQRKEKERRLQQAMRDFRRAQQAAQEDIDARKNQVLQDIYDQVSQIIKRIGEQEDFDLILTGPSAMYVAERVDLTPRVVDQLNSSGSD
ncbi:MAG TPA: OmpH family outer membrane protein [Gammaproteobacteria bacterium]|nr:OmpH family outer membrane protein [Gammaproteobacteria bacterium]